ncbi:MAG: hypothetical protein AAFN78_15330 [Pseudomonadota bacterium]
MQDDKICGNVLIESARLFLCRAVFPLTHLPPLVDAIVVLPLVVKAPALPLDVFVEHVTPDAPLRAVEHEDGLVRGVCEFQGFFEECRLV